MHDICRSIKRSVVSCDDVTDLRVEHVDVAVADLAAGEVDEV